GLRERRCVGNGERHVEHPSQGLREQRLARAGRTEEQDVGLGELDIGIGVARFGLAAGLNALVVVVYGYRERLLGLILTDDIAVEEVIDLARLRQLVEAELTGLGELFLDDFVTQVDALVADVDARACDELFDLLLALPAEGALEQVTGLTDSCHERFVPLCCPDQTAPGWAGHPDPERYPELSGKSSAIGASG